jgi:hypothetical protein
MATEAAILLRAGNLEAWQSHFFSKPKAKVALVVDYHI